MIMFSKGHYLQPGRCLLTGSSNCEEQNPRSYKVGVTLCKAELSGSVSTKMPVGEEEKADIKVVLH